MPTKLKMHMLKLDPLLHGVQVDIAAIPPDITEDDALRFSRLIDTRLDAEQRTQIVSPPQIYPRQARVLAVHWHPEFIPMELIAARLAALYPNMQESLIIPTQHNELMSYGEYAGVEIDCYSHGFKRKVQLLLHFKADKLTDKADKLRSMCAHTLKYRATQLFEFLDAITDEIQEGQRLKAAAETGADEDLVEFCCIYGRKLRLLIDQRWTELADDMIKNKLVRNFFESLKELHGQRYIGRAQAYLRALKEGVKANFSLKYFYRASEVIEEARSLGAGVVIPHPEQFWPILLADYDVDGVEVWNPQSSQYTEFLINVLQRQNRTQRRGERPLLVLMGDDCHMSEKALPPAYQDPSKRAREIGLQPAWEDMAIRKSLIVGGVSRGQAIQDYRERLG